MDSFYNYYLAVTPSDTVDGPFTDSKFDTPDFDALYIGTAGNAAVVLTNNPTGVANAAGTAVTFVGLSAGQILRVAGRRVNNTNTTASNIVALRRV